MAKKKVKTADELRVNRQLRVPVSVEEKSIIQQKANEANLSMAEYLRFCGLNKRIVSRVDNIGVDNLLAVNADLARLGNLLKLMFDSKVGFKIKDIEIRMSEIKECRDVLLDTIRHIQGKRV